MWHGDGCCCWWISGPEGAPTEPGAMRLPGGGGSPDCKACGAATGAGFAAARASASVVETPADFSSAALISGANASGRNGGQGGASPIRLAAAGALRFDKLVGMPIMENFYGKSADVFGAVPSLHVVYPYLCLCYTWRVLPRFRWIALAYWLLILFSAVYLNHHYFLDIFVGISIATLTMAAFRLILGPVEPDPVPVAAPAAA